MGVHLPASDETLPAVRALFAAAGAPYKIVGGLAVIHHGYLRFTQDVDLLVSPASLALLAPHLLAMGFEQTRPTRLLHVPTGVRIDLLVAGDPIPPRMTASFPSPESIEPSPRDAGFAGLSGLITLKLRSARSQDRADIVALLKPIDELGFIALAAQVPSELRTLLGDLRAEAIEELRFSGD